MLFRPNPSCEGSSFQHTRLSSDHAPLTHSHMLNFPVSQNIIMINFWCDQNEIETELGQYESLFM